MKYVIGKPVRLISALPYDECLTRIAELCDPWDDYQSDGPWGWRFRSFLSLWSERSRYSPMVMVRLKKDGASTRITGRAGPDLNGTPLFLAMFTALIATAIHDPSVFSGYGWNLLWLLLIPAWFIIQWNERNDADPLVEKLQQALFARDLNDPRNPVQ